MQERLDIKTPEYVSLQFQIAGLGSRAAAMIIDQLIITVANLLILLLFIFGTSSNLMMIDSFWPIAIAIIIIFSINWGYFFVAEYFFAGKTIGKHVVGIRVIQENGHSLTLLASFIRNLIRIVDMLPSGYFLGIILIFFHSKHKRLGDMAAGTLVVHERKKKRQKEKPLENEIRKRGLTKESIALDEYQVKSLGKKEWDLLKTYSEKIVEMDIADRSEFTKKLAHLLLPKVGVEIDKQTTRELEDGLLVLYLYLKDEWEFEL